MIRKCWKLLAHRSKTTISLWNSVCNPLILSRVLTCENHFRPISPWRLQLKQTYTLLTESKYLATLETLVYSDRQHWKLAKKFNSTSFNLKQEVFIRRDEEKTRRGLIYIGGRIRHLFGSKSLTCESNLHTFSGGSVIFDQCHIVWRAVAIKLQHMWMCLSHSWGDEGMTLLNSCQVLKSLACIDFCGGKQLNWGSIEQVSSPASPSGWSRYVLRHVWSKIPNIVELG